MRRHFVFFVFLYVICFVSTLPDDQRLGFEPQFVEQCRIQHGAGGPSLSGPGSQQSFHIIKIIV
jgi:hypothetical protein